MSVQTGVLETRIPARLDRLPWSRFHWRVIAGLGTVWILDGLEVTIVGAIASRLTEHGSGIAISSGDIGIAAAAYVAGACSGALFFGQLTDRFGRKRLFMITLGVYILATVATAGAFNAWYLFAARFFTGAGIGGEYSAINSAIDELIPARVRGRVDLIINGSFWVGSMAGSAAAILLLNKALLPADVGWRIAFLIGALLGLGVLLLRRSLPESPRWLFIHGREQEAEAIVDDLEREVESDTGSGLPRARESIRVRQRTSISFRTIASTAFRLYPRRAVLGLALFVGQAFLYNGLTFNLGTLYSTFFKVSSGAVPIFTIVYAASNFLGPLILGRLFDTVGRKPMISLAYLGSAAVAVALAVLFPMGGTPNAWIFEAFIIGSFFLASAGASAAYLTVSEIFPMETRALAIAFFYAVGTAVGGITGPLLFGQLIASNSAGEVAIGFYIGAAVMAVGGLAEIFLGVNAERRSLESIALPLTAIEAGAEAGQVAQTGGPRAAPEGDGAAGTAGDRHREALRWHERAELARAEAASHRATAHELRAAGGEASDAGGRQGEEERLAILADERALMMEERATASEAEDEAERTAEEPGRKAALERARAAEERSRAREARIEARSAVDGESSPRHRSEAEAEAAEELSRAHEQLALAWEARAGSESDGGDARVAEARAAVHESWAAMHQRRAAVHRARTAGDHGTAAAEERRAREEEERALAAEERLRGAEHEAAAAEFGAEREHQAEAERRPAEEARRHAEEEQRTSRMRERATRRAERERRGLRRYLPGPGSGYAFYSPGMLGSASAPPVEEEERALDQEIEVIGRAVGEHGALDRDELARLVGARYWGPGRFRSALSEAAAEGRIRRVSRSTYAPPDDPEGENPGDR
jgi:MFS family permease